MSRSQVIPYPILSLHKTLKYVHTAISDIKFIPKKNEPSYFHLPLVHYHSIKQEAD